MSSLRFAIQDIKEGLLNWRIWFLLSQQDIQMRYRRSTLGPFWITLSVAITIYSMGFLYGKLFHIDLNHYYPFLATGMISWALIASLIMDGTNIFIESESFLKQMKQPYFTFILRVVTRNFVIFFHNVLVLVPIAIFFDLNINFYTLLVFWGLFIIWLNAIFYGLILAILGTRFRDLSQLVNSLMQVIFFLTPVMWIPSTLPPRDQFFIKLNPFAQFLELLRNPLLGSAPSAYSILFTLCVTLIGLILAFIIFKKFRARIVYWL